MKKNIALLIAAVLLCTGCKSGTASEGAGSTDSSEGTTAPVSSASEPESAADSADEPASTADTPAESTADTSEQQTAEITGTSEADLSSVLPGAWRGDDGYYIFRADGSGSTRDFEMGIGVAFAYEVNGTDIMFHMAAADDNTPVEVLDFSEYGITLKFEDGTTEQLVNASNDPDSFVFYTDEDLQKLALAYYQANYGYTPSSCGIQHQEYGLATIQLYDSLDDHNSTAAWYTVDRITLYGSDDINNTQVNFNDYVSVLSEPEAVG